MRIVQTAGYDVHGSLLQTLDPAVKGEGCVSPRPHSKALHADRTGSCLKGRGYTTKQLLWGEAAPGPLGRDGPRSGVGIATRATRFLPLTSPSSLPKLGKPRLNEPGLPDRQVMWGQTL